MTLDKWLTARGMTNEQFAGKLNSNGETVRRYRKGLRWPDRETMLKIFAATGGQVTANDFCGIHIDQSAAA